MAKQNEIRLTATKTRRCCALVLLFFALVNVCIAQDATASRKIKNKVAPVYPELARKMNLVATVKVQVTVGPNGSVTQAKALGGHPLLVDPSVNAAKQCRFEPGADTTTAILEFHFAPGTD